MWLIINYLFHFNICTHLEVSSAELRLEQVKFIQKKVKSIKNPVFLAGDMNAEPDSPEMAFLRKGWDDPVTLRGQPDMHSRTWPLTRRKFT